MESPEIEMAILDDLCGKYERSVQIFAGGVKTT